MALGITPSWNRIVAAHLATDVWRLLQVPVVPEMFNRVEFGRIDGQLLGFDVAVRVAEKLAH